MRTPFSWELPTFFLSKKGLRHYGVEISLSHSVLSMAGSFGKQWQKLRAKWFLASGGFPRVVRVLSGDHVPLPSFKLDFASILPLLSLLRRESRTTLWKPRFTDPWSLSLSLSLRGSDLSWVKSPIANRSANAVNSRKP